MKTALLSICLLFSINAFAQDTTEIEESITFTVVPDMPCFPGCDTLKTFDERKQCTERNLLKYLYQNIKYPTFDKENNIDGLVVLSFLINTEGKIEDVQIIKDRGGQLALEVKRVILMMNDFPEPWTAGTFFGKKIEMRYNLPIRIKPSMN